MRVCCIFNIAPTYRKAIFGKIIEELDADIYCGDHSAEGIAILRNDPQYELHNIYKGSKLVWQKRAIRQAFSHKYDAYILTGNAGILSNWVITCLARMLGRKVYLWSHGLHGNESKATLRKNLFYFKLAGNMLLYGERARDLLAQHGITKTTVIYNSLDYDKQLEIRAKTGDNGFLRNYFGNNLPTICYLGRVMPNKKLDLLLRAICGVCCNLVIVGGGSDLERLEALAESLGVDERVWFYGESYDEIFNGTLLANCVVTVNPSSIGLTAIHSLMFGTPVITHDNLLSQAPEAEVIVEGVTGYYYTENDEYSLRDAILKAITAHKPVQNCYDMIDKKYNPNVQIETLKSIFGTKVDTKEGSK